MDKSFKQLAVADIEPSRIVTHIVDNKKLAFIPLSQPTEAQNLKCPNCSSKRGFWNSPENAWGCKEDDCLVRWLPETSALKIGYISRKMKEKKK